MIGDTEGQSQTLQIRTTRGCRTAVTDAAREIPVRSDEEIFIMRVGGQAQEHVAQGSGSRSILEFQNSMGQGPAQPHLILKLAIL